MFGRDKEKEGKVRLPLNPIKRVKMLLHLYDNLIYAEKVKYSSEETVHTDM